MTGVRRMQLRRAAQGLTVAALILAAPLAVASKASADGVLSDSEYAYVEAYGAGAVCPTIAAYPSTAGVMGVASAIMQDGFTADSSVDIINASVATYCPRYWPLLQSIGAEARGEGPLKRAI